ncbi:MAG TPA: CBS domain-containing protein [Acidimicrobiales bacterium]|nr:CBS domain-containing protein [Acidimicrobiales bacterium]
MEIDSLITRAVLTVSESDSLRDTAVWMIERGVGSAVVLTDGKPSGIITDRDALRAIARGKDAGSLTVGDLLPGKLTTVRPDLGVLEAARIMRDRGFRHLVVVDEAGDLAGVFSMRDLVVGLLTERDMTQAAAPGG